MNTRRQEKGFFTILAAIAISIAAMTVMYSLNFQKHLDDRREGEIVGNRLSLVSNGLRSYIAEKASFVIANSITTYTNNNIRFLKSVAHGGTGTKDYIPASLNISFPFGSTLTIRLGTENAIKGTGSTSIAMAEACVSPMMDARTGLARFDLAEVAKRYAMSSNVIMNSPVSSTTYMDYVVKNNGAVCSYVSNSPSTDAWLRTDGSNQMHANLNVGGNDIVGTRNMTAIGNIIGGDVRTMNGRTLKNVVVAKSVVSLIVPAGANYAYVDISKTGFICDPGTTPQLFITEQYITSSAPMNGRIIRAINLNPTTWRVYVQVHDRNGAWSAPARNPYITYEIRCL